ncbi:DUF4124 domain-containing protein [Microbulbifer sp. JMSA004]|uniref:DUF4124 domain-containing protein n=1 Tax=unclassified Microbulbifer TaxID=2619833 RepID=UPI0024ADFD38|nr:DUF4124 domain-containing protein [Microbulbifer sp. VAAF005]WHI45112.1 DUF4124 domain-containing protein [Microbulbifer sp. VAAF005]
MANSMLGVQTLLRAVLLILLLVAVVASAESGAIYKIVGPDGQITFSDTPPPNGSSEEVELTPLNVQPIALPRQLPSRKLSPNTKGESSEPVSIQIVSPINEATIPPGQTLIALQIQVTPAYPEGSSFYAIIDGQRWQGSAYGNALDISALERGTHTLQAVLVGSNGQVLAQSKVVTIYVKRPIARG